jgi:hypothetical protein
MIYFGTSSPLFLHVDRHSLPPPNVPDKIEVVNQLAHNHVLETVRKYGVNYDRTWSVSPSFLSPLPMHQSLSRPLAW